MTAVAFPTAPHARRFRTALNAFDIASLAFIVAGSFIVDSTWERIGNMAIAAILVANLGARTWIESSLVRQLRDTPGRLLAVAIMIVGFGLFLRLVQAIFRPRQRRYECPDCGLLRHDSDAVHCKHCGRVIKIPNEGIDA